MRFFMERPTGKRKAAQCANEKMSTPGVLSPKKGVVRNSTGSNQFPETMQKRRKRIMTLRKRLLAQSAEKRSRLQKR